MDLLESSGFELLVQMEAFLGQCLYAVSPWLP